MHIFLNCLYFHLFIFGRLIIFIYLSMYSYFYRVSWLFQISCYHLRADRQAEVGECGATGHNCLMLGFYICARPTLATQLKRPNVYELAIRNVRVYILLIGFRICLGVGEREREREREREKERERDSYIK